MRLSGYIWAAILCISFTVGAFARPDLVTTDQAEALLTKVGPACLSAKKAADLDKIAAELAALNKITVNGDYMLARRSQACEKLVTKWREYLSNLQSGQKTLAWEALGEILNGNDWPYPLPRSAVQDRYKERFEWHQTNYDTDTLEDLPVAIQKLQELERTIDNPGAFKKETDAYSSLLKMWKDRREYHPERIVNECSNGYDDPNGVTWFKLLILPYALPGYLELDKKYQLAAEKGELAPAYLKRLMKVAIANADLVALWRLKTYYAYLTESGKRGELGEQKAMEYCLKAQRLEVKGELAQAVLHYRSALQCLGNQVTEQIAKDRLLDLAHTASEAYREGASIMPLTFVNPYQRFMAVPSQEEDNRPPGERKLWKDY